MRSYEIGGHEVTIQKVATNCDDRRIKVGNRETIVNRDMVSYKIALLLNKMGVDFDQPVNVIDQRTLGQMCIMLDEIDRHMFECIVAFDNSDHVVTFGQSSSRIALAHEAIAWIIGG